MLYAPLPDEELPAIKSAAFEFSDRARVLLCEATTVGSMHVVREDMTTFLELQREDEGMLCLIVISCDADGSVHKNVRKVIRKLSTDPSGETGLGEGNRLVVILLGHAVCSNSAMQTDSEIYRHGRKLAKMLGANKSDGTLLEIQVELDSPEDKFDPFIQRHGSEVTKE